MITDWAGFPVETFRFQPCELSEVSFGYSVLGEELLVTPELHVNVDYDHHDLYWTDTLSNEEAWHIDRKVSGNDWSIDYAVLPPGANGFVDTNIDWGSVTYRYRLRPSNAHQSPAYSERIIASLPNPPQCVSARMLYFLPPDLPWNPAPCSQNWDTCSGWFPQEEMMAFGDDGMAEAMAGDGGGGTPGCLKTNAMLIDWEPARNQAGNFTYCIVKHRINGDSTIKVTSAMRDTICLELSEQYSISVVTRVNDGGVYEYSEAPPYTLLNTGGLDWCRQILEKQTAPMEPTPLAPAEFTMTGNSPNPFNAGTVFSFRLAESEPWKIDIIDVLGRTVRSIEGEGTPGQLAIPFDGRNEHGDELASGVYFWRLTTPSASGVRKMSVVK